MGGPVQLEEEANKLKQIQVLIVLMINEFLFTMVVFAVQYYVLSFFIWLKHDSSFFWVWVEELDQNNALGQSHVHM